MGVTVGPPARIVSSTALTIGPFKRINAIFLAMCRFVPTFREQECAHSPAFPMRICKF